MIWLSCAIKAADVVEHTQGAVRHWEKADSLFPYLILADGFPAGFNRIATGPHVPDGIEADAVIYGCFVLHAFRGIGVADRGAIEGLDAHRGEWEIVTYPTHGAPSPSVDECSETTLRLGGHANGAQ